MINIDQSLLIQIINLLLLMLILNIFLYRPIRNILKQRSERVRGLESEVGKIKEDQLRREQDYQDNLLQVRKEGFGQKEALRKEGQEQEKEVLRQASQEAEGEISRAKERIRQQLEQARVTLQSDLSTFSREIAQKILGRTF